MTPPDGWHTQIVSALELDSRHRKVARYVTSWLQRRGRKRVGVVDTAVVYTQERVRFESRQTKLDFADATDLPTWVPVDYQTRLDAMQMLLPELVGYALLNAKRDAVAVIPATPDHTVRWKSRRCFVSRLADFDFELSAPAESIRVLSLRKETAGEVRADSTPNGG